MSTEWQIITFIVSAIGWYFIIIKTGEGLAWLIRKYRNREKKEYAPLSPMSNRKPISSSSVRPSSPPPAPSPSTRRKK